MQIDILALDGGSLGGLAATGDVLEAAGRLGAVPAFDWRVIAPAATVSLRQGVRVAATPFAQARPGAWVVVLGLGAGPPEEVEERIARPDAQRAAAWLRRARAGGARVAASCTGVFLVAEAGLLAGRRCTTSWWLQGLLARRTPDARLEADPMVVADDPVWTAGPAYAHLDLMLAVLGAAASPEAAAAVARRLTLDHRPSQGAYVDPAALGGTPLLATLEAAVSARLAERITLDDLAQAAGLSSRTLSRRVQAETGLSPMRFVQKVKLDAALRLIRGGDQPLVRVAEQVGLGDAAALHRLVVRHTRRAPGSFRVA